MPRDRKSDDPILSWDGACAFLDGLPGSERDPPGGREVVRVAGKVVAFPARNDRSRPDDALDDEEFLIVKVAYTEREALLHQDPTTFFVTPHYETYPGVIVRLATVDQDQLRELLMDAWRLVAPKKLIREFDAIRDG